MASPHLQRYLRAILLLHLVGWSACSSPTVVIKDPTAPAVRRLVDLREKDDRFRLDLRYATTNNFTGKRLYPVNKSAWLVSKAADALGRVQQDLERQGLGLKIFDAYRPYHVQERMWDLIRDERYVSNPAKNAGRHTRGTAVDVTLVDRTGRELEMPTAFDDFSERAHRDSKGISPRAKRNSQLLESAMVRHGFIPYPYEWWHFDFRGWENYPPLDVPLTELSNDTSNARR